MEPTGQHVQCAHAVNDVSTKLCTCIACGIRDQSSVHVPHLYNVTIRRYGSGILVVTDTDHKVLITVKSRDSTLHTQRLLVDATERPIARLREKNASVHDRWNAFRGESKADSDLIFSTVSNHMIQSKTHVKVFLATKASGRDDCDFKIKGNWSKRDLTIYMGDSSTIIAQILKTDDNQSMDKFMVTIYPNVDYVFVVALIAMVDVMENNSVPAGEAAANGVFGSVGEQLGAALVSS